MKHSIKHEVNIDGIVYQILEEEDVDDAINFFFAFFFKGKSINAVEAT
jgi:hypothetical protein